MADEITAVLNVLAYGFKVTVLVNGIDVGIKGGQGEAKRLFVKNSPAIKTWSKEVREASAKKLACLNKGQNEIFITYKKLPNAEMPRLTIDLSTIEQPQGEYLFYLKSPEKDSDKIKKTFIFP